MAGGERTIKVKFAGDAKDLKRSTQEGEKAVSRWQKTVGSAGAKVAAGMAVAGAAIGGALSAGIGSAIELSSAKAKLAAQIGGENASALGAVAGKVYAQGFGDSVEAVGETLRGVLTAGLVDEGASEQQVQGLVTKAQTLADVFGQDVQQSVRAAGQLVRTGLAKNADEAFDVLSTGFQVTGDHAGDLLDTFSEYSTQFRKLGVDGPSAIGLISQGLQSGARDADTVADALKEFSIRAIDGSKTTAAGFKALGLNAKDMQAQLAKGGPSARAGLDTVLDRLRTIQNPAKQAAAATALFGTKAEDLGASLFALDPSAAAQRIGEVAGATDRMGKTMSESAGAKLEAFKRKIQTGLVGALGSAAGWIERNQTLVKNLAMVLVPLVSVVGTIVAVTKVWTAVQTAWNVVMALNPIGLVIIGIAALVAGLILAYRHSATFRAIVQGALHGVATAALWLWNTALRPLFSWWMLTWRAAGALGMWLYRNAVMPAFRGIGAVVGWVRTQIANSIQGWVIAFRLASNAATSVRNWVVGRFQSMLSFVTGLPGRIRSGLSSVTSILTAPFRAAFNGIARLWNNSVGQLSFSAPGWVPGIGGKGFSMPRLPQLALGGPALANRSYLVGERGPEILTMGSHSGRVTPNGEIGGDTHVQVIIDGREVAPIAVRVQRDRDRQLRRRVGAGVGTYA